MCVRFRNTSGSFVCVFKRLQKYRLARPGSDVEISSYPEMAHMRWLGDLGHR